MNNKFLWSDGWWIEGNIAWFISGEMRAIFSMDLEKWLCKYIVDLPEEFVVGFRSHPRCMRFYNTIWCFPLKGNYILIYDLRSKEFRQIEIKNTENRGDGLYYFKIYDGKLFGVAGGDKQIIKINMECERVEEYYSFATDRAEIIGQVYFAENSIYIVSQTKARIYEFSLKTKQTNCYDFPAIKKGLRTICFDGENFWFSGFQKEIFIWNKEKKDFKILKNFPDFFGYWKFDGLQEEWLDCKKELYETPAFVESVKVENKTWFIPNLTNQILYVDIKSFEIKDFEIEDEEEGEKRLRKRFLGEKYLLVYVRDERYIGLFSTENECYFEIDTKTMKKKELDFVLSDDANKRIKDYELEKYISKNKIKERINQITLDEKNELHRDIFQHLLNYSDHFVQERKRSNVVGGKIYNEIRVLEK